MCSPSSIYQLIATWADVAAIDGIGEGIRGGVSSFVGMRASQIMTAAVLTIVLCVVSLVALRRVKSNKSNA
jgi:hypothetical protein